MNTKEFWRLLMIGKFVAIYCLLSNYDLINWKYVIGGMAIITILHHINNKGEDDSHFIVYLTGVTLMITELALPTTEIILNHDVPIIYLIGVPIEWAMNIYILYKYFSIVKYENDSSVTKDHDGCIKISDDF